MTPPSAADSAATPALSVVIPTLNESRSIRLLLGDLRALDVAFETIVVDGGSTDDTMRVARELGARVLPSRRGRGVQLASGARAAVAPMLCFLHADVRLPKDARLALGQIVRARPTAAHAFRFSIDATGWQYRFIELGARLRMRLFKLPYGDQGLVVSRTDYDASGGYPDTPLMEDVALIDALRRITSVREIGACLPVSARRWQDDGPLRRMLRNWGMMIAYRLGASPEWLASQYRPRGDSLVDQLMPGQHG